MLILCLLCALLGCIPGCARSKHLQRADRAAYSTLQQKTGHAPWRPPANYNVLPDPRSRFYDPTCIVDPRLPSPAPVLYGYALPELTTLSNRPPIKKVSYQAASQSSDLTDVRSLEHSAWTSLPDSCLRRMLEFQSVRKEYKATYPEAVAEQMRTVAGERLHLPAIVELALINSREYQTQKEALYRVALRLTLERFSFDLQFFPRGNGTRVDYSHARNAGSTVNTLRIPTALGVQQTTRYGANLLAQFANDIVLTFNGPTGFSSRIGSELLFQISQTIFQRDVIFESLTQAERDVIYAARDFARFRKEFFVDFARDYYSLLLAYRSVEINSFDYFSNYREFRKGEATFQAGKVSRIQVDQFEQNALRSRRNLVRSCNALETSLDNLKLRLGVPPEIPLNIDLNELDILTQKDSLAATVQQATRNRRNLQGELQRGEEGLAVQLNLAKLLTGNLRDVLQLQQAIRATPSQSPILSGPNQAMESSSTLPNAEVDSAQLDIKSSPLADLTLQFDRLDALLKVGFNAQVLESDLRIQPPVAPLRLFQRRVEVARALLEAKRLLIADPSDAIDEELPRPDDQTLRGQLQAAEQRIEQLVSSLDTAIQQQNVDAIDATVAASEPLLIDVNQLTQIDPRTYRIDSLRADMAPMLEVLFRSANELLGATEGALPELEVKLDEAMLTATTQRYELATTREQLADTWRQIKLRGDDLRAIAGWSFRQSIRTPSDRNRPFSFTFDESESRLAFSFDAPLNRFRERNDFRLALLTYNQQLRRLLQLEDQIKLAIRNDIRNLNLDRNQYEIAVASAALAAERVYSTRLRFDQGSGTARDFLEAQQAFTESLSAVASERIGFLVDRLQLFLDLEQLEVDERGFWPDMYNDTTPVWVRTEMPQFGMSIYGDLPCVKYSACMERMLAVPAGVPRIEMPVEYVDGAPDGMSPSPATPNEAIETPPPLTPSESRQRRSE